MYVLLKSTPNDNMASLLDTFTKSFDGLRLALKFNPVLRIQFLVGALLLFCSVFYPLPGIWRVLLACTILLVMMSELFRLAISESSVRLKSETHFYIDSVACAGVLMSYVIWGVVWLSAMFQLVF